MNIFRSSCRKHFLKRHCRIPAHRPVVVTHIHFRICQISRHISIGQFVLLIGNDQITVRVKETGIGFRISCRLRCGLRGRCRCRLRRGLGRRFRRRFCFAVLSGEQRNNQQHTNRYEQNRNDNHGNPVESNSSFWTFFLCHIHFSECMLSQTG